ncbi:MAG: DUF2785 domain-containing protein [Ignavibacteriales bacterium]|jgi:hypothetical protein|nr:MAG: DUF2785 domain-containing protein [Ignavibacteriales bacterium]
MDEYLFQSLKDIKKNKYQIDSSQAESLIDEILPFIGDQDPIIRDQTVYGILAHLFHDKHLSKERLTHYLHLLISDQFLFFDIKNHLPYSVLKRSFTILQLVIIVYVHRRDNIISHDDIQVLYEAFIKYFQEEKILIGYEQSIGWMHSVAHSADLFAQLMQIPWFDSEKIRVMLHLIAKKMMIDDYLYISNEDERMVVAIKKGLDQKKLSQEQILSWLDLFLLEEVSEDYLTKSTLVNNIKHLLSALYFDCLGNESYTFITEKISKILLHNKAK